MALGKQIQTYLDRFGMTQTQLSEKSGVDTVNISAIIKRDSSKSIHGPAIAKAFGITYDQLLDEHFDPERPQPVPALTLVHEEDETEAVGRIPYWPARGSCGGGFLNYELQPKGHLTKEASFFRKYQLSPENGIAIYADGDSMSDFIVDGDIVIFDKSKTSPVSGKIFLIEHPDGLRIKIIRRGIDGSITLSSRNPDKTLFPDEVISPDQVNLLKIHGQFVYRQGG